jgi:hypothetical protein
MEILEAYDLTGSFRDAGVLAGCSHHTVAAHVAVRDAGGGSTRSAVRALIDAYLAKVEEWVRSRQAACAGLHRFGTHHASCGRDREEGLPVWSPTRAPALGHRAGDVDPVRLR